jgi:hypothetical protein
MGDGEKVDDSHESKDTNTNKLLTGYEPLKIAQPKLLFKELWNHSKPHFNTTKNLDGLLVVNHYNDVNTRKMKQKYKNMRNEQNSKRSLLKHRTTKNLKSSMNKEKEYSDHANPESIVSGESTPSEFPMVKSAVRFLLNK